jgi:hypothetical protein
MNNPLDSFSEKRTMATIGEVSQIQNYFYLNETNGLGPRNDNIGELKKGYTMGDLLQELHRMLEIEAHARNPSETILFTATSYIYLYAYFVYLLHGSREIYDDGASYILKFEKASRPGFLGALFGSRPPPANLLRDYEFYKSELPLLSTAIQNLDYNVQRVINYPVFADEIRARTHDVDRYMSRLKPDKGSAGIPPEIFLLMDYMDRAAKAK